MNTMKKWMIIAIFCLPSLLPLAQTLPLGAMIDSIAIANPVVKMYNHEIRSMDEAAKGAKSWMPPEITTGMWMVPYNPAMWQKGSMGEPGMGQYMIGGQ